MIEEQNSNFISQNPKFVKKVKKYIYEKKISEFKEEIHSISSLDSDQEENKQKNQIQEEKNRPLDHEEQKFKKYVQSLMEQPAQEAVIYKNGQVPEQLRQSLMKNIDQVKSEMKVKDYHPGSNNIVLDIVHQSMYPFVLGESVRTNNNSDEAKRENLYLKQLAKDTDMNNGTETTNFQINTDIWGREFLTSNYQWLPTNVAVDGNGVCSFKSYINNLPQKYEELYHNLEDLMTIFVPHFKKVLHEYIPKVKFSKWDNPNQGNMQQLQDIQEYHNNRRNGPHGGLYGANQMGGGGGLFGAPPQQQQQQQQQQEPEDKFVPLVKVPTFEENVDMSNLQIIPKIVDYELQPGQTYDGVWHVEGMSHENIIATGVYFINIDEEIKGGDLYFKRNFSVEEREELEDYEEELINKFSYPIGNLSSAQDNILVFPNSHIHKLNQIVNTAQQVKQRRIIAFFLVNPKTPIVSTQFVPRQQDTENFSWQKALDTRLASMSERKYAKIKLNQGEQTLIQRDVNYCEH